MAVDRGYNGNLNIPASGSKHGYTQHELEEYIKCRDDPVYFAETYFKIIDVDKGLMPMTLYPFQKEAARAYLTHRKICLNTSRQVGKTSVATVIILHFTIFNSAKRVALLANKGDAAREILERIKLAYEYLPRFLQVGVVEWNKGTVLFENNSKIIAASSSSSAIRGKSMSLVYIDENAFVPNWLEFSASVLPTLSSGKDTRTIFTSTPNGLNHFYYYCKGAKEGKNGFYYIEVPWYDVPGRDEKWKQEVLETINHDLEKFAVEYCCQFSGSSGTLISGNALQALNIEQPIAQESGFYQYEKPSKTDVYFITADVARGKGLDYSTLQIIKLADNKFIQVATYNNNLITPIEFAGVVFNIAKLYNNAPVLIEINDIGGQIADLLHYDYEYENIISTESSGRAGKRISTGGKSSEFGIRTTKTVKATGCAILKLLIEQERLLIRDANTINQLNVFSRKNGSYAAEEGHHDDLVMPLVLFAWLTADSYFIELSDSNILLDLAQKTEEQIFADLTPFGFIPNEEVTIEKVVFGNDVWTLVS